MKKVGQQAKALKVAHNKRTNRTFQTIFKLLGRTLYDRALLDAQKAIVDKSQSRRPIDYLQMEDPVDVALQIVKLVAVNPPISTVTSLIL